MTPRNLVRWLRGERAWRANLLRRDECQLNPQGAGFESGSGFRKPDLESVQR